MRPLFLPSAPPSFYRLHRWRAVRAWLEKRSLYTWRHKWPGPCRARMSGWDAGTPDTQNDLATLAGCLPSQHPDKPAESAPSLVPRAPLPLRTAVNRLSVTMWQSQGRRATPGGGGRAKAPKATSRHCRERPESPRCRLSHDHLAAAAFRFPLSSPIDAAEIFRRSRSEFLPGARRRARAKRLCSAIT